MTPTRKHKESGIQVAAVPLFEMKHGRSGAVLLHISHGFATTKTLG